MLKTFFQNYNKILFPFLLGCTPFFYLPFVNDPAHSPVYFYLLSISLVVLIPAFVNKRNDFPIFKNPIQLFLGGIIVVGSISVLFFKYNSESRLELARIISLGVFYNTLIFYFLEEKRVYYLLLGLLFANVFYLCFGYADYVLFYDKNDLVHNGLYDIKAHIGHKNLLAIFLTISFPLIFFLFQNTKIVLIKYLIYVCFLAGAIFIIISQSRVGVIGLGLLLVFFIGYQILIGNKKNVFLTLAISLIAAVLFFAFAQKFSYTKTLANRILSLTEIKVNKNANTQTIYERVELWKKTILLIQDHPIAGVGLGQWKLEAPGKDFNQTRAKYGNIIFQQPHNDLLWFFAEYGIAGLAFYVGLFCYLLFFLTRQIFIQKSRHLSFSKEYLLLSGLCIYFVLSLFDFPKERPIHLFLLAIYLAVFTHFYLKKSELKISQKKFSIIVLILLDAGLILFFLNQTRHEYLVSTLLYFRKTQNFQTVIAISEILHKSDFEFDYTATPIDFYEAESLYFLDKKEEAIHFFKKAIEKSPYHLYSWSNLGGVYYSKKENLLADECWNKAIAIASDFAEPHLNKAISAYKQKNNQLAMQALSFHITDEDFEKNKKIIRTICQSYLKEYATTLSDAFLADKVLKMSEDEKYMFYVYRHAQELNNRFDLQAINEIIYGAETVDRVLTKEKALFYRKKYLP